jgi:hypothetical protein
MVQEPTRIGTSLAGPLRSEPTERAGERDKERANDLLFQDAIY